MMTMDKWVVNNYIVQMRSGVIQARVHVLNKLVREIRKLQNKKGSEQQKEKNHRKAERFKQEVLLMKKLVPNEVSKFALLFKENPEDVLKKDSISLEERAKVRLTAHKCIVQRVEIFRAKHPDWELKLPPLLVQLGLKNKYKKSKSEEPTSHSITKSVVKASSDIDEENDAFEHSDNDTENKSSVKKSSPESPIIAVKSVIETNSKENILSTVGEKKKVTRGIAEVRRFADLVESNCSESSGEDDINANTRTITLSKKSEKKKKDGGIAEVRRFADLIEPDGSCDSSGEMVQGSRAEDEVPNPANASADPFFLTGDDSGGSDESDVDRNEEEGAKTSRNNDNHRRNNSFNTNRNQTFENSGGARFARRNDFEKDSGEGCMKSRDDQKVPTLNRRQRRLLERANAEKKGTSNSFQINKLFPKPVESSTKKNFGNRPRQEDMKKISAFSAPERQESLHPSWEAKRKQREQQILPFQGKKIKFDDDD